MQHHRPFEKPGYVQHSMDNNPFSALNPGASNGGLESVVGEVPVDKNDGLWGYIGRITGNVFSVIPARVRHGMATVGLAGLLSFGYACGGQTTPTVSTESRTAPIVSTESRTASTAERLIEERTYKVIFPYRDPSDKLEENILRGTNDVVEYMKWVRFNEEVKWAVSLAELVNQSWNPIQWKDFIDKTISSGLTPYVPLEDIETFQMSQPNYQGTANVDSFGRPIIAEPSYFQQTATGELLPLTNPNMDNEFFEKLRNQFLSEEETPTPVPTPTPTQIPTLTPTPTNTPTPTATPTIATALIGVIYNDKVHQNKPHDVLESRRIQFTDIGEEFATINFSDYDILIITDTGSLAPQFSPSALLDFVSEGGVLYLGPIGFNGTRGRDEVFQRDLYPYSLYMIGLGKIRMADYRTWIEKPEHPIFSGFESVKSIDNPNWQPAAAEVASYGAIQWVWVFAEVDPRYDVLLSWGQPGQKKDERSPILLEARVGDGTILISQLDDIFARYNQDLATTKLADNVVDHLIALTGKPPEKN